jgi:hypothetical protein
VQTSWENIRTICSTTYAENHKARECQREEADRQIREGGQEMETWMIALLIAVLYSIIVAAILSFIKRNKVPRKSIAGFAIDSETSWAHKIFLRNTARWKALMMLMRDDTALSNVLCERAQQDDKWGEQNHEPPTWLMILGEEVGEANKAALEHYQGNKELIRYRDEMVQVCAVALAAIESFDRMFVDKTEE